MTDEQEALLRKARASIAAAELLRDQGFFEFAASRAYYAMFYVAQAFLLGAGLAFSKHSAAIAAFGHQFAKADPMLAEFHRYLIDAHDARNVADYDIAPGFSVDAAREHIERAKRFLEVAALKIGDLPDNSAS
jgi:uncharacterized protein (UPF0332 family)